MSNEISEASAFILGREIGQFETGSWWSAIDRLGEYCVCAVTYLDEADRATLDALQRTARGWPGLAKLIAIEDRNDGSTLLVYRATLDEVHVRSRHAPLSANDALTIVDQLLVEIDAMHEAGIIHPGISTSAIERQRSDYGFMSARLRGVGLPPLPGRSAEDDLYDLAATIDAMVVWGDEADDDNGLHAALERALGPVEGRFKTAGEMLLAVRGAPRPRSGHRIQQGTMPGMRNAVARNTQRMLAMDVSLAG